MSSDRRQDFADRPTMTDEANTFKKPFQTVDRPQVTERDIHQDYMQEPPRDQPFDRQGVDHWSQGFNEGAREETDPKQDGVLGDQATGRQLEQSVLGSLAMESSVHPGDSA